MLTGTLDTFSVGEILELVGAAGTTGALRVRSDADEGCVQCHDGAITFATVGENDLGAVLVRGGFIAEDDWQAVVEAPEPATHLVEVLDRTGVDTDRLQRHLATQTEESVFELDCWKAGDLRLEVDVDDTLSSVFRYPTIDLLASLKSRKAEWTGLLESLGSPDRIVHQAAFGGDDDAEMSVSRAHLVLLSRVDGRQSVRELARSLGAGLFHTCKMVASLLEDGLVVLSADRSVPIDTPATRPVAAPAPPTPPTTAAPADPPPPPPPPSTETSTTSEFVEAGEGPARDLIIRLLSAVKEEL